MNPILIGIFGRGTFSFFISFIQEVTKPFLQPQIMKKLPHKLYALSVAALLVINLFFSVSLKGQENHTKIEFPDIPGFRTLKCDFHMHSVFSDGSVWPDIRVQEALRHGLDAIAITDHLEYQPKQEDVSSKDMNRSYQLARQAAQGEDLLIINAAEITRSMPPGHANALFLEDANKLKQENVMEAFMEARRQGAFVFWNHPDWTSQKPDGVAEVSDMHLELFSQGLIQGIEIVNGGTYSEEALQIAGEYNLSFICNSDVHGLIDWEYDLARGKHRPVTLVFAKEKSEEALKEGLMEGRTALWFENTLVGKEEFLNPLITSSLTVERQGRSIVQSILLKNQSDVNYILENQSDYNFHNLAAVFTLEAHETKLIQVKTITPLPSFSLQFKVLNAFTAPRSHPEITILVK